MQFTTEFCVAKRVLILSETDREIRVGCGRDLDANKRRAIAGNVAAAFGRGVAFVELSEPELMRAINGIRAETKARPIPKARVTAKGSNHRGPPDIREIFPDAPIRTELNSLLLEAELAQATDVHLEAKDDVALIRFRVDGVMKAIRTIPIDEHRAVIARIKLLANLNTLETRRPQDGSLRVRSAGRLRDVRVSSVPSVTGESVTLRLLDATDSGISLESLGFGEATREALESLANLADGLVIACGPTGCGKTTTLAALVRRCGPESKKIVSVEDPVEYRIGDVVQIQTDERSGMGFGPLLSRILRQDPDVILIGEIRDRATAEIAVRAALTGHLVFTTLHARSAEEARSRLADMGVAPYLLDAVTRACVSQRLLRKVDGSGGYAGRVPVAEILVNGKLVTGTLRETAESLVKEGVTDWAEVRRIFGR